MFKFKTSIIAALAIVCLLFSAALVAQAASSKKNDIRTLLQLTGATKLGDQMMDNLTQSMATQMPQVPADYWQEFKKGMNTAALVDELIAVYDKHLNHKDVKGLLKFYRSDVGRKFIKVQPQIVEESMAVGQNWGQKAAQQAMLKMQQVAPAK